MLMFQPRIHDAMKNFVALLMAEGCFTAAQLLPISRCMLQAMNCIDMPDVVEYGHRNPQGENQPAFGSSGRVEELAHVCAVCERVWLTIQLIVCAVQARVCMLGNSEEGRGPSNPYAW